MPNFMKIGQFVQTFEEDARAKAWPPQKFNRSREGATF
jgi:hypothetical protein